jgi:putative hydroxymethylpyrimidine transport system substrate-binding protein
MGKPNEQLAKGETTMKFALSRVLAAVAAAFALCTASQAQADMCGKPAETDKITVVADWLPWASQGPFYAASMKGFYKDEGLTVDVVSPATSTDPIKLVARERAEFSMTYVPDIMAARDTGIPVTSVAAMLRPLAYGMIVAPELKITSPAGFKGKTVGVSAIPATRAYFDSMLASVNLTEKDMDVVDPGYSNVTLLESGKLSAISGLSYSELMSANEQRAKDGKPNFLYWPFTDYGVPNFYFMVLAGNDSWLKEHPAATCRFLRATQKGYREFAANPDVYNKFFAEKNDVFNLQDHANMTKLTMQDWLSPDGKLFTQDESVWSKAQDWALKMKLISIESKPNEYFTNDYLPE